MAHEKLDFPLAPKKFKKVKTVSVRIAAKNGEEENHELTVYMWLADVPTFHIMIPDQYYQVWTKKYETRHNWAVNKAYDGVPANVSASSFADALGGLSRVSYLYGEYVKTASIEMVIAIKTSLVNTLGLGVDRIAYNVPSFLGHPLVMTLDAVICYKINGDLYDERDGRDKSLPLTMDELYPSGGGYQRVLPYSDEAWATVTKVQDSMARAIKTLHSLMHSDQIELLLKGGNLQLLEGPKQ